MNAATTAKRYFENTKLLVFSGTDTVKHTTMYQLEDQFKEGDLLVVNRSATLPGSFRGHLKHNQVPIEIRLAAFQGPDAQHLEHWYAIAFGEGNWRQPTEARGPAPLVQPGDTICLGENLNAHIISVHHNRVLEIQFGSTALLPALYRQGKPIQYAYHEKELAVWDQQTIFSGPPISAEPPSAGFPFTWEMVLRLKQKGVKIATLLHSAGISSTGDPDLDRLLPLQEWYEIPVETVAFIQAAHQQNRRVIALGTTVLRALESAGKNRELQAGPGLTTLKITPGYSFQQVDTLITGMHEPESSHMRILDSLCPMSLIQNGYTQAREKGYRGHEYGDLSLLNCKAG